MIKERSRAFEMDGHERHPKRRKIYEAPPQPAGIYTTSEEFPAVFQVQQSGQSCLRSLLKSPNQGLIEHNQYKISSESAGGNTPKRTITPDRTWYNKSCMNEMDIGDAITVVMESGSQPSLADSTTYQAPRMLQEELEEISPTSLGQALRKELQKRAVAIQRVLSKHMFKVRSKINQLERENRELRQFACSLDKTLQDVMIQNKPKTASRETQVNMALENDLKVSRGTQVNMRIVFKPVLPDHKAVPIPRLLSHGLDGSGKSQLVYLPTNRATSGSNSVSNEGNEISVTDHEHQYSNERRSVLDKTLIGNGSYPQTSMSPMEPKHTMSDHQDEPLGSRRITAENNEIWFSKSTQQADNHPRIDKVFSQVVGLPIEEKPSSISTHRELPFTSMASNEITGQKNEKWSSKPTDSVSYHPSVDKASSQIVKTPVAVRTSSISAYRNASCGSMASEDITTQEDEVPVKQVQNGVFDRSSYSADTTRTTGPSVSESSIQRAKIKSQFPSPKPDITRSAPQIRKDESSSLKDNLQNAAFSNSSSMELFLTVNDPERSAPDRGPFSIQRLLSSHKPSKETQVTNIPSSIPYPQKGNVNMLKNPTGVSLGATSSLKAGFRRDKDLLRPSSKYDPESIQILDNTNGLVEVTSTPSSLSSLQDGVQSLSPSGKSSSYTSSRDSMVGRHTSHSSTASPNGPSEQGKSGIYPAPLQTTSSNISPAFHKHHKPSQNSMSTKIPDQNAISPKESSVVNTHTNTWIRQNPNDAREPNSQLHFQSSVLKLPRDTTSQKRNLPVPVATVQAMRSYSNSFKVISSVSSAEQLNRSRNDSGSPNVLNSNESKRNTQQWRHKDPKIQAKRKQHDKDTFHLPVSTASLNTSSKNSDLQTFVSHLTEDEIPNARSVVEKQTFEASFNIAQESLLEGLLTSKTVLTIQPGDNRKSFDQSRMGMHNNTDFYLGATERERRPSYDNKILQSQSYFTNADIQYRTKGTIPSGAHYNPQNRLNFEHCPMRQVTRYKNQQSHLHHRNQKERSPYKH